MKQISDAEFAHYERLKRELKTKVSQKMKPAATVKYDWLIRMLLVLNDIINTVVLRSREREFVRAIKEVEKQEKTKYVP